MTTSCDASLKYGKAVSSSSYLIISPSKITITITSHHNLIFSRCKTGVCRTTSSVARPERGHNACAYIATLSQQHGNMLHCNKIDGLFITSYSYCLIDEGTPHHVNCSYLNSAWVCTHVHATVHMPGPLF